MDEMKGLLETLRQHRRSFPATIGDAEDLGALLNAGVSDIMAVLLEIRDRLPEKP